MTWKFPPAAEVLGRLCTNANEALHSTVWKLRISQGTLSWKGSVDIACSITVSKFSDGDCAPTGLNLLHLLSAGSFFDRETNCIFPNRSTKRVNMGRLSERGREKSERESKIGRRRRRGQCKCLGGSTVSQDPVHPVLELARDSFGTCSGICCVRVLCWLVSHYAHLDVRLANICFKKDGTAMLIDLDRSRRRHNMCEELYILYGESVMYKAPKHWTVDKLDWRQLGLMICSILEGHQHAASYHSHEPSVRTGYLFTLLSEGENRESLLEDWKASL